MAHNYKDLRIQEPKLNELLKRVVGITDSTYEINFYRTLRGNRNSKQTRLTDATGFFSKNGATVSIKLKSVTDKEVDYFGELTIESRRSSDREYETEIRKWTLISPLMLLIKIYTLLTIKNAIDLYFSDKKRH